MLKTKEDLERQFEALYKKHPNLEDLVVKTRSDYPEGHKVHDYNWMAKFIDKAWFYTYTNPDNTRKSRFIYSSNYLEWLLGGNKINDELTIFVEDKNGEIVGLMGGVSRKLKVKNFFNVGTYWGISVPPEHTKKGISQLLFFKMQE